MKWQQLVIDGFSRSLQEMEEALKGLKREDLDIQPHPGCNSIGWTAWHLARVQDAEIANLMGAEQLYIKGLWYRKLNRKADPGDTGYGHTAQQVAAFRSPGVAVLLAYHGAALDQARRYISGLTLKDLDRELDEPWWQPVPTVGVRLMSVLTDGMAHAGEVDYLRGLLQAMGRLP